MKEAKINLARAERNQKKREEIKKRKSARINDPIWIEKEKKKNQEELNAINNKKGETTKNNKASKRGNNSKYQIGSSKENRKWRNKRFDNYNKRVWKGWDRIEESGPVITFNASEFHSTKDT